MTFTYDDLAEFYRMGYYRGRFDALAGRPYDARLPDQREDDAPNPSSASVLAQPRPPDSGTRTNCSDARYTRTCRDGRHASK